MGAYVEVFVDKSLLPTRYRNVDEEWQTNGVVEPIGGRLKITTWGMFYTFVVQDKEYCIRLEYNGIFRICSGNGYDVNDDKWDLLELAVKYTNGTLICITDDLSIIT